jgi:hypothetical protein
MSRATVESLRPLTTVRVAALSILLAPLAARATETERQRNEFANVSLGGLIAGSFGTSAVGDAILGDLGAEYIGIRSFRDRSLLLQWDALLAARGGILGNEHPYMPLAGAHERGNAELGYRFLPQHAWSPYAGARIDTELTVLTKPGVPISRLNEYNNSDGVGGLTATGDGRVAAGSSWLTSQYSLLIEGFFQEALRAPELNASGISFSEGGFALRFDIARRFTVAVDGFSGSAPGTSNSALGYHEQTVHEQVDGWLRYTFGNRLWLGASFSLAQETHHVVYSPSGLTFDSADAPMIQGTIFFGVPFGRQE